MPQSIEVIGARELAAAMNTAAGDPALFAPAAADSARIVASRARQNAPARSGRLRSSIQGRGEPSAAVVTVGVVYGGNQEFGWHSRPNASRGWRGGPFPGHYMVMNATRDTETDQMDAYTKNAQAVLDQIAGSTPRG